MGEKIKTEKSLAPLVGMIALGIICSFIFGFVVSNMVSKGAIIVPEDTTAKSVNAQVAQVTFQDGTTMGTRLAALEKSINKYQDKIFNDLRKGLKESINNRRILDLEAMPVQLLDLSEIGGLGSKGPEDALVTIVEFSDYQCPYCSKMAATLEELWEKHPDDIRLIFVDRPLVSKHRDGYPFHPFAFIAHEASREAQAQGKFWKMYNYLFEHQSEIFPKRPKTEEEYEQRQQEMRDNMVEIAGKLGLDKKKMKKALDNHTHKKALDRSINLAGKMGITGTPTVYVNAFFKMRSGPGIEKLIDAAEKMK